MRVIAGSARRLNLVTPRGMSTRPTSDKVKETLFNILAPDLYDAVFLDLFAGSGGIGIEALSRGSSHCTFIEKDKSALECIRKNLETTHFSDRADVFPYDVLTGLHTLHNKQTYDIVFMDPPYDMGLEEKTLRILSGSALITKDTLIIAEVSSATDMSYLSGIGFDMIRVKEYKNNKHVFIKLADTEDMA